MAKPRTREEQDEGFFNTRMGVWYPTQHAVIIGRDPDAASRFAGRLVAAGFDPGDVREIGPVEMHAFLTKASEEAGLAAQLVGSELKQMEIMRQFAADGDYFVLAYVPDDEREQVLRQLGAEHPQSKALFYRALAIEELPFGEAPIPGDSPLAPNETPR